MKLIKEITDKDILGTDGYSYAKPRITARAILKNSDDNYAVMYSEDFNFYSLPGGGAEGNEDIIGAVKRELLEETGCICNSIKELGVVKENRFHCNYTQISYYFVAETDNKILNPAFTEAEKQHKTTVSWHNLDDMVNLIFNSVYDNTQRMFLQARDAAALKEYLKEKDNL